jgi:hypothetical protein
VLSEPTPSAKVFLDLLLAGHGVFAAAPNTSATSATSAISSLAPGVTWGKNEQQPGNSNQKLQHVHSSERIREPLAGGQRIGN